MNLELHPPGEPSHEQPTKLNERSMLSVHLVILIIVFVVWLIRLSDKVEENSQNIIKLERMVRGGNRVYRSPNMEPSNE